LLGITQADLAERSGVSLRTVANFETGERQPIPAILAAIQRALETAGIVFLGKDRSGGPGVRLAKRRNRQ
jgi:transcriptional regulator with XRE-family HTH domain